MKTTKALFLLCIALCFATSCKKEADMTLVQKTVLENADIRQIEVGDAWEVTIIYDSLESFVELEYSAYLESYLKAKMEGTKLEIGFISSVHPVSSSVFRASVHTNRLEKLEAKEATQVQCNGIFNFQGQKLELHLSEAAQCYGLAFMGLTCKVELEDASLLTGFTYHGTVFNATLKDASQFNGEILASQLLEINLSDASRFVDKGTVTELTRIHLSDASLLNMAETQSNIMEVEIASGSEATVQVTDFLRGTIQGTSTLFYKGHPQIDVDCSDDSQLVPF